MFTNVSSPLSWNFSQDTIPKELKSAPQFLLNNPVALQRRYLELRDDPSQMAEMREVVTTSEQKALEMLVHFFDWLDRLKPQPMTRGQDPNQRPKDTKQAEPPYVASNLNSDGEISNYILKSKDIPRSDSAFNSSPIRPYRK